MEATQHDQDRRVAIDAIRAALGAYVFRATSEDDLQSQVFSVLAHDCRGLTCSREVRAHGGRDRYDILARYRGETGVVSVVLELKLHGSAARVERQAQRYALTDGVDAVAVVTTSQRLAHRLLEAGEVLAGKPLAVIVLRTS